MKERVTKSELLIEGLEKLHSFDKPEKEVCCEKARKEFDKFAIMMCRDERFQDIHFKVTNLKEKAVGATFVFKGETFSVIADGYGTKEGYLEIGSLDCIDGTINRENSAFHNFPDDDDVCGYLTAEEIIEGFDE